MIKYDNTYVYIVLRLICPGCIISHILDMILHFSMMSRCLICDFLKNAVMYVFVRMTKPILWVSVV